MRPTLKQKKALMLSFGVARAAYNFANDLVRNYGARPWANLLRDGWNGWKEGVKSNQFGDSHQWRWIVDSGVHTKIEAQAIRQLAANYASIAAKNESHPVDFRSYRKMAIETLLLEKGSTGGPLRRFLPLPYVSRKKHAQCLVKIGGNSLEAGPILLEDKKSMIERLVAEEIPLHDGKIIWNKRLGTFHFCYTYELPALPDPDPRFQNKRIVAADPGVFPFQAWYSPTSGEHGRLLDGETEKLHSRCLAIDKLQSRCDKHNGGRTRSRRQKWRTRRKLRRRLVRERKRLTQWVEAAHYDCINLLLRRHDLILQPKFETARLSRRRTRNIRSDTVRKMCTWSHYKYRQRLKSTAARYPGRHVIETSEPGTSKTCTHCGFWKADLRVQDKVYNCPACGLVVDRQLAGARNNFFAAYGMAVRVGWDGVSG